MRRLTFPSCFRVAKTLTAVATLAAFLSSFVYPYVPAYAQIVPVAAPSGGMLSPAVPVALQGLRLFPEAPMEMEFLVSRPEDGGDIASSEEIRRQINYFLASLTIPEEDLWVNLSPEEPDRVIPETFGLTEMGRDMLAQDFLLKQIASGLMNPDGEEGRRFWNEIYEQARARYGTVEMDLNAFSRVWIVPETAVVFQKENTAFIVESRLKVLLEEDYRGAREDSGKESLPAELMREIILPVIERKVNEGDSFASLRQIYHALILATWYKNVLRDHVLSEVYIGRNRIAGVEAGEGATREDVHRSYLDAVRQGAYDILREDYDPASQQIIPRKYFSGGVAVEAVDQAMVVTTSWTRRERLADAAQLATARMSIQPLNRGSRLEDTDIALPDTDEMTDMFLRGDVLRDGISEVRVAPIEDQRPGQLTFSIQNKDGKSADITVGYQIEPGEKGKHTISYVIIGGLESFSFQREMGREIYWSVLSLMKESFRFTTLNVQANNPIYRNMLAGIFESIGADRESFGSFETTHNGTWFNADLTNFPLMPQDYKGYLTPVSELKLTERASLAEDGQTRDRAQLSEPPVFARYDRLQREAQEHFNVTWQALAGPEAASLTDAQKEAVNTMTELTRKWFEDAGLNTDIYHNGLHNDMVASHSLRMAPSAGLLDSPLAVVVHTLAGYWHDFDLRAPFPNGEGELAAPALVEETIRQLARLLDVEAVFVENGQVVLIRGREMSPARPNNSMLREVVQDQDRETFKAQFESLASSLSLRPQNLFAYIAALIRRTDFQPIPEGSRDIIFKMRNDADQMAKALFSQPQANLSDGLEAIKTFIELQFQNTILPGLSEKDRPWAERQQMIETAFYEQLKTVPKDGQRRVYELAAMLEAADVSAAIAMTTPAVYDQISENLGREIPGVGPKVNYTGFINPYLLNPWRLATLARMPEEHKRNFLANVKHAAELSGENTLTDWQTREPFVRMKLGLAEADGGILTGASDIEEILRTYTQVKKVEIFSSTDTNIVGVVNLDDVQNLTFTITRDTDKATSLFLQEISGLQWDMVLFGLIDWLQKSQSVRIWEMPSQSGSRLEEFVAELARIAPAAVNRDGEAPVIFFDQIPFEEVRQRVRQISLDGWPVELVERGQMIDFQEARNPFRLAIASEAIEDGLAAVMNNIPEIIVRPNDFSNVTVSGRSLIINLEHPVEIDGVRYKVLTLKGVTDNGREISMTPYIPSDGIIQPTDRIDIDSNGQIGARPVSVPSGTLQWELALNEYVMMRQAAQSGIPTGLPVGLGQWTDLQFQDQSTGFVMILYQSEYQRFSDPRFLRSQMELDDGQKTRTLVSMWQILSRMHQQGIVHGMPSIIQFGLDSNGQILIHDFEGAINIQKVDRDKFIFWALLNIDTLSYSAERFIQGQDNKIKSLLSLLSGYGKEQDSRDAVVAKKELTGESPQSIADFFERFNPEIMMNMGLSVKEVLERERTSNNPLLPLIEGFYDNFSSDPATLTPGGIDFTSDRMGVRTLGEPVRFEWTPEFDDWLEGDVPGVVPVILNIAPLPSLPLYLGLAPEDDDAPAAPRTADIQPFDRARPPELSRRN